ncbi:MAG TPA: hypothetical protein VGS27_33770 [Candidatus Sulfotelmatobacter sp.]|nr:hypothetical protein [Candidatus Sulfotelmatobacter sp.]
MFGRSASCLLVTAALVLPALPLRGQTDQRPLSRIVPEYLERQLLPHMDAEPLRNQLRFPVTAARDISFPRLSRAAGMIFSGTVLNVERRPATVGQTVETVAITFHVESALRGVTPGENISISQWIGLWSSGQRYRIGERVVLFLYPPSKLGLTSAVGGPLGRFAVDRWGRVQLTPQHLLAFRTNPVLGGKSRVPFSDFALAVRRAGEEE